VLVSLPNNAFFKQRSRARPPPSYPLCQWRCAADLICQHCPPTVHLQSTLDDLSIPNPHPRPLPCLVCETLDAGREHTLRASRRVASLPCFALLCLALPFWPCHAFAWADLQCFSRPLTSDRCCLLGMSCVMREVYRCPAQWQPRILKESSTQSQHVVTQDPHGSLASSLPGNKCQRINCRFHGLTWF
jgi:hypothetical protein